MTVTMKIGVFWDVRLYSWYRGTNISEEHVALISRVGEYAAQIRNLQTEGRGAGTRAANEPMGDSGPQKGYFVNERVWTIINKEKR
jgi:hypothetical protein